MPKSSSTRAKTKFNMMPNGGDMLLSSDVEWEGFVEHISPVGVRGWVRSRSSSESVRVEIWHNGTLLGLVDANDIRTDLSASGKGSVRHGFHLQVPFSENRLDLRRVVVRVLGTDHCLPILENGAKKYDTSPENVPVEGFVEALKPTEITGWAWSPGSSERLEIDVEVDGTVIASACANIHRADLVAAGKGDGCHGFWVALRRALTDGQSPVVRVRGGQPLEIIPGVRRGPAAAVSGTTRAPVIAPPAGGGTKTGAAKISRVEAGRLIGWAELPEGRTTILITVDGKAIGEVQAGGLEGSLAGTDSRLKAHGFVLPLPSDVLKGRECLVRLYDSATGTQLATANNTLFFPCLSG